MAVGPRPMRTTSQPLLRSPSTSRASSPGELSRPSRPTATRRPPARRTKVPKLRPTASASSSPSVSPTTPLISYSRRDVGLKRWLIEDSVTVGEQASRRARRAAVHFGDERVSRRVDPVGELVRAAGVGVDPGDQPPVRLAYLGQRRVLADAEEPARLIDRERPHGPATPAPGSPQHR